MSFVFCEIEQLQVLLITVEEFVHRWTFNFNVVRSAVNTNKVVVVNSYTLSLSNVNAYCILKFASIA